ncbi:MAG: type I methionyl aminopeptidase [Aeromicrobium sp.]|uniref:type I methionyl aminopeptidase n=1 Tax=Aeromicrobium sp. TaxID=1871063 RepID=UPI00262E7496|nr:type I methionyl aminopeptidase [Aeromicrobium sp.]MDF1704532.1 type I methionyl aminopeptidase [Aeromicrobium sp.]
MFGRSVEYKTADQIAVMRRAGAVVAEMHAAVRAAVAPGVTTRELDLVAREVLARHGATSNFLGYGARGASGEGGFSGVICTSVNDEVVHGIPGERILRDGDLVSVDAGAVVEGWHGDAAITVPVGTVSAADAELSRVTEAALWAGIEAARPGARLGDIGHAIAATIRAAGDYGIVEGFTGHGIGTAMHMDPDVANTGRPGHGMKLKPGLVIAIEPMVSRGSPYTQILEDDWTAVTIDGSRAAHWEHTVAVTAAGPVVLTLPT